MRRVIAIAAALLGLVPTLAARAAEPADEPQSGAALVDACAQSVGQAPEAGPRACRSAQSVVWGMGQACRRAGGPDDACIRTDGRDLSEAAMAAYEASWTHRALTLQRELDEDVPLQRALVPHTHNSFNSTAYMATLSGSDPNQAVSMTDQLRLDMRALEIDVHWFPSPTSDPGDDGMAPIMCHGEVAEAPPVVVHAGCTIERHLRDGLAEIDAWLATRDQVEDPQLLILYLENGLDGPAGHAAAARTIEAELGDRVVTTPDGDPCAPMPLDTSRRQLLGDAGTSRVLIVGNCIPGASGAWGTWVHERGPRWQEGGSGPGDDFDCEAERKQHRFDQNWIRHWEDSTWLSTMAGTGGEMTRSETRAMVACGVHMPGFDQLRASDSRLAELVWSWAPDQPAAAPTSRCAAQSGDARFVARDCRARLPFACVDGSGTWRVTTTRGRWASGDAACARAYPGSRLGVPANGYENGLVRAAAPAGAPVWLDYRQVDGDWTPRP